ncbi:MAG: helicase-exonuclease AddAB subunit AddA [Sedimentisphaerales bacterium]|nr:helicase-exonuclease AddAB subunit AddA [Sedimentisphaerales bacterium]
MNKSPNWTPSQKQAIVYRGGNLLVTAGAGSGKTAVLTARCIGLVTDRINPCGLDELLVLTFTNAAAGEMRRRIGAELRRFSTQAPDQRRLERQIALLDQADICTIHAFCANLVREHFYRLGIDPNFELMDEVETDLLQLQAAEYMLADAYENGLSEAPQAFADLLDGYGHAGDDRPVITLLLQLQRFLETLADAQTWRQAWRQQKTLIETGNISNLAQMQQRQFQFEQQLSRQITRLRQILVKLEQINQLTDYIQNVRDGLLAHLELMQERLRITTGNSGVMEDPPHTPSLTKKYTQGLNPNDYEPAKEMIQAIRKEYINLQKKYTTDEAEILHQARLIVPLADALLILHERFDRRYQQLKQNRRVLDFSDLEHLALRLLQEETGSSDIARQLQQRYRYVLIDEYQDISPVQEKLLERLARSGVEANRFMVGDVKQSIYGFRRADPTIFLEKYEAYPALPVDTAVKTTYKNGVRVELNHNFRSRRQIIDGVNAIFSRCMTHDFCGVDYMAAPLLYGADYPPAASESAYIPEVHLIERNTASGSPDIIEGSEDNHGDTTENNPGELDATQREAAIMAQRIRRMVGADDPDHRAEFTVRDADSGEEHPVRYRDIVILLRSMKLRAEVWAELFGRMGVPVHAELSSGYFVATEIQDMLNLLRLLDNPRQDIPLAGVLRSPLVNLDDNALAAIRLHTRNGAYHQAVKCYTQTGPDETLRQQLGHFLKELNTWRTHARQSSLADIIWTIYRQTDFLSMVSGLPGGPQRYQNLLALHDRARQFDSFSRQGIARFLRFIEKLRDEEGDFGPAPVLTEADDVVRIMSVHKSKGLEFPVVIVAGLAKQFNLSDARRPVLFDRPDRGVLGMQLIEPFSHNRWPTLAHRLLADHSVEKTLTEELRLLYVALTRAKEKLILSGAIDFDKARKNWRSDNPADGPLPPHQLQQARNWADWVGPALAHLEDMQDFFGNPGGKTNLFHLHVYEGEKITRIKQDMDASQRIRRHFDTVEQLAAELPDTSPGPHIAALLEKINHHYPHLSATRLPARFSVTELKRLTPAYDEDEFVSSSSTTLPPKMDDYSFQNRPAFLQVEPAALTPAEKGVYTHLVLQHLTLEGTLDEKDIQQQIDALVQKNLLTAIQAQSIDVASLTAFFTSPLGREMRSHQKTLRREWPFTLGIPAGELITDGRLNAIEQKDIILVRGIIDCFYETEAGAVIVDFKTDSITADQCPIRAEHYRLQLALYRRALETILHRPVHRQVLYFLTPAKGWTLTPRSFCR